jgi:hypothetical protein
MNPMLFRRLRTEFSEVEVRRAGEKRIANVRQGLEGELETSVQAWGETYLVACPFCRDRRLSLAISYEYGQADDGGDPQIHLAACFRKRCLANHSNRLHLAEMLGAYDGILGRARIRRPDVIDDARPVTSLPSPLMRVGRLPKDHPARVYLSECGFRPDKLGKFYEVSYCSGGGDRLSRHRIIIPVRKSGDLAGWQAIAVPVGSLTETDAHSVYLSCKGMMNSRLVYNLDKARTYETAVVVPGPMQVWAIGLMGISALGGKFSEKFTRQIITAFRGRSVVVLMPRRQLADPRVQGLVEDLQTRMPCRVAVVATPRGIDAGSRGRKALREHVRLEADKQGVRVSFAKRT